MKGEYVITRDINGNSVKNNIDDIVSNCNNDLNKVSITFNGMSVPVLASVTPRAPKPPPVYAGEGTLNPAYPDRGDVPTNLGTAGKNVGNPNKSTPGAYVPPTYVVAGNPTVPSGGGSNPGSFTRPTYPANNPLGPLYNPPDLGNEWVPATPPTPPRPPATAPPPPPAPVIQKRTITLCTVACTPTEVSYKDGYLSVVDFWGCYREQYFIFGNTRINAFEFKHYVGSVLVETDPWGFGTQSRLMTQGEFDSLTVWSLNCGRPDAGS